jgi:GT2 family glycosyltransferase
MNDASSHPHPATSGPAAFPPCTLIICSRNRPELLSDLVTSILGGRELPSEIVIVDQSDERHPALAEQALGGSGIIRYEWSRTRGASRARNIGIQLAKHEILAFSDDDMLATPPWLGTLVRALVQGGRKDVVTGRVSSSGENPEGFAPSTKNDLSPKIFEGRVGHDVLFTGNMAMYRATTDDVGLFDERLGPGTAFPAAEDNDFGFRILESGYRIIGVPEAVLHHRDWRSSRADFLPLRWRYGVGQGAFLAKHLRWGDRHMATRLFTSTRHYTGRLLGSLRRNRTQALGDALYLAGLYAGAARWLVTQRGARTNRRS